MKPNKLDSIFSAAKHVIIETKARDTLSIVNVDTGTTLQLAVRSSSNMDPVSILVMTLM